MANAMLRKLACIVVVCIVVQTLVVPQEVEGAITACNTVVKALGPCIQHLRGAGGPATPPPSCCSGIASLKNAARTTSDRRMACNCIKSQGARTKGLNYQRAASLASQCRVNIGYSFNRNINCNSVN